MVKWVCKIDSFGFSFAFHTAFTLELINISIYRRISKEQGVKTRCRVYCKMFVPIINKEYFSFEIKIMIIELKVCI